MSLERKQFLKRRIRELAAQKGISEYELSYALGKNKNYIRKITTEGALPSMGAFFDICEYFEITPKEFFDNNMENPYKTHSLYEILNRLEAEDLEFVYNLLQHYEKRISIIKKRKKSE